MGWDGMDSSAWMIRENARRIREKKQKSGNRGKFSGYHEKKERIKKKKNQEVTD